MVQVLEIDCFLKLLEKAFSAPFPPKCGRNQYVLLKNTMLFILNN